MTHYDREKIFERAAESKRVSVESIRSEFVSYELTLKPGDTAYAPGTTKYYIGGPGIVLYEFQPKGTGDNARIIEGTHKTYRKSE